MNESIVSRFIDREQELGLITERLDGLLNRESLLEPVLFFHGVARVGKTRLLSECQQLATARGIPVAFIDFDRERSRDGILIDHRYEGERGQIQLVDDILVDLVQAADAPAARPIKSTDDLNAAAEKLLEYTQWLQGFLKKPVTLLFDTLEEAPRDTFLWFQEKVLAPLLERQQVFVMFASWSPPRESVLEFRWQVARHMRAYPLKPLTEDQTLEHLRLLGENEWSVHPHVTRITGGLPGLNEEVLGAQVHTELDLLRHMVRVIFDRMGKDAEKYRAELLALSQYRQFDTRLLEHLLKTLWSERYKTLDRRATREILKNLRETILVEQHPDGYGYVVPSDVRTVLDYFQRQQDPKLHHDIHCLSARWFRSEVEQGDAVSVADELFHIAGAWRDVAESDGKLKMPSDLPNGNKRLEQLQDRLAFGLKHLKENKRADELANKIAAVINGEEFYEILSEKEVNALLKQSREIELEK